MPSPESGKQWPAESPTKNAVLRRRAQPVGKPVALVADGWPPEPLGQLDRRLAHVVARLVRAHAHALLAVGRHAPPVAVAHQRAVDPDVEVDPAAGRVHLEPARQRRIGRLGGPRAPSRASTPPPERRRPAARSARRGRSAPARRGGRRRWRSRSGRRTARTAAGTARRSRTPPSSTAAGSAPTRAACGRPCRQLWRDRGRQPHRLEPGQRRRARGGGALADLVAVHQQHVGAVPASSRATASPAKLAPQISTSAEVSVSGARSAPRRVARRVTAGSAGRARPPRPAPTAAG